MPRLIMRRGPTAGAIFELATDDISIGRGRKNQIVIHDNEVSREHCRLIRLMDDYEVQDLNSSNGTFVNGLRVTSNWMLQPGSLVELGDSITLEYDRYPTGVPDVPTQAFRKNDKRLNTDRLAVDEDTSSSLIRHCLMMTMGPTVGRVFFLNEAILTIGRDSSSDVVIQDPEISRNHLRLRRSKTGFVIEDTGSTNGTFINGALLETPHTLQIDDVIRLGTMVQLQYTQQLADDEQQSLKNNHIRTTTAEMARDDTIFNSFINPIPAQRKISRLGTGLQPGALENHIFIAYARDEWESVIANLTLSLQDAGLNVWVDQYLVQGSDDWRAAVEQALLECWLMVLVVSPTALTDNIVHMKYLHFVNRDKPIIPLIYNPVKPMPDELKGLRTINYDDGNPRKSFHKLIFEIMQMRR